jgi:hypothetical protein
MRKYGMRNLDKDFFRPIDLLKSEDLGLKIQI